MSQHSPAALPASDATTATAADVVALAEGGDLPAAARLAASMVEARPDDPKRHRLLAVVLSKLGRTDDAIAALRRALAIDPAERQALFDLANLLNFQRRPAEALDLVERLLRLDGDAAAEVHYLRVLLLTELGRHAAALTAVEAGLAAQPDIHQLQALKGGVLRALGLFAEALALQEAVLAKVPDFAAAKCEKGWALRCLGRPDEAIASFEAALAAQPAYPAALSGKGLANLDLHRFPEALAAYDQALAIDPRTPEARFGRASCLEKLHHLEEARAAYEELLADDPDNADAHNNLGNVYRNIGMSEAGEASLRRALEVQPDRPNTFGNLLLTLLYRPDIDRDTLRREHAAYGERYGWPEGRYTTWPNDRTRERKLNIGLVSAELCQHAVTPWLMPFFEGYDRDRFTVSCYSMRLLEDEITAQIKPLVDGWAVVVGMDDHTLAERIRADGIDILIDISGHTTGNRLTCFALKPAPVQVHWLGYPYTTGLPAIDYIFMDDNAVRPGEEDDFVEKVIRLPNGRFCYQPSTAAPRVVSPPALRNGWPTFGSFNNIAKLTDAVLDSWCALLRRVPNARLVIKSPSLGIGGAAATLRAAMLGRGIAESRLELRGGSPYIDMLREYGDIDVALDPFPFGGGATTCDALWMGVPVVTLPSWQPVSRQSEGFLRAIGRPEWVARDVEDYLAIAAKLASDPLRLQDLRMAQRDEMVRSRLCDRPLLVGALGDAFEGMWKRYGEKETATARASGGGR